ncbi:MAG TPA: GNAT family N-acetyltransferase [Gemmataceae bacterium]|nr:GNAT family N-acetyltransferase [Gemmataceae bacterium]
MRVVSLHRRDEIEPVLRRNVYLHIYALGDLDDFFWPFTTWYALEDAGTLRAIVLLYTAFETPTLMALGDPPYDPLRELLQRARRLLPPQVYAHLSPGCRDALGPDVRAESRGPHLKMALVEPALDVPGTDRVERMTAADVAELRALYLVGYPANWFDPRQIETGHYYGLRISGKLVSAAGPHVYSPGQRVAALGNIVTHPDHRGRGLAGAVTARLCTELRPTVDHVGLNVKADNAAALACYSRLGFRPVAEYEEVMLTLPAL